MNEGEEKNEVENESENPITIHTIRSQFKSNFKLLDPELAKIVKLHGDLIQSAYRDFDKATSQVTKLQDMIDRKHTPKALRITTTPMLPASQAKYSEQCKELIAKTQAQLVHLTIEARKAEAERLRGAVDTAKKTFHSALEAEIVHFSEASGEAQFLAHSKQIADSLSQELVKSLAYKRSTHARELASKQKKEELDKEKEQADLQQDIQEPAKTVKDLVEDALVSKLKNLGLLDKNNNKIDNNNNHQKNKDKGKGKGKRNGSDQGNGKGKGNGNGNGKGNGNTNDKGKGK